MHSVSRNGPKPLEGLLRGKECGSALDLLGPARTMHARYSYRVWWGVMLPEEVHAVIGGWCGSVPARLAHIAVPPASWTAALLHALAAKSVISTFPRVLQHLRHISVDAPSPHAVSTPPPLKLH
jgi:hypothetical protein